MLRVRRAWLLTGAWLGIVLACSGGVEDQSLVGVPTDIEQLRDMHAPPEVVVDVQRVARPKTGGAACGHSPLCVVILPALLYEHYSPERYDQVSVHQLRPGGKAQEIWAGSFETDGTLLQAVALDEDRFVSLRLLRLDQLGRHVVVESGTAAVLGDGTPGDFSPTTVQSQVDLLAEYRVALDAADGARRAEDRGELLVEVWTWLGDEALPLLHERLPGEADAAQAPVMERLCRSRSGPELRAELLGLMSASPGLETSSSGHGLRQERGRRARRARTVRRGPGCRHL